MTGRKPSIYWLICWRYISPIAMVIILVASFVQMAVSGAGWSNPKIGVVLKSIKRALLYRHLLNAKVCAVKFCPTVDVINKFCSGVEMQP